MSYRFTFGAARAVLLAAAAAGTAAIAGCDSSYSNTAPATRTFTVTVQNVSTAGLLSTMRAMGTIPLSPGAYAVFNGTDPMFTVGSTADAGTERIAEDGFPMMKAASLATLASVQSGTFDSPGGPDNGPAIFAGETSTFTITASPGARLQFELMFVQSNDWFYSFGSGGLSLFTGDTPVSGDVTSKLVLYDAGTELDTAPGTGAFQKPVQDPTATNVGPPDPNPSIRTAASDGFPIPATASVIRVTITPQS